MQRSIYKICGSFLVLLAVSITACGDDDTTKDGSPADASSDSVVADDSSSDAGKTANDPAPDADTSGEHGCTGCPDSEADTFTLTLSGVTKRVFEGTVTGAQGDGVFYVVNESNQELFGAVPTNESTGAYSVEIPLFCGAQLVKLVWSNASGGYAQVTEVTTSDCVKPDIRLTVSWDALGDDWELHLIKQGGQINDNATDCTWTSCISGSPDWGVQSDDSDDPHKDVDDTDAYGPENIWLAKPETGTYTVMVEHWGTGTPQSDGQVMINLAGKPPVVVSMENLAPRHVWTVATIDWPAGVVTTSQDVYDCSGSWNSGCTADIP